MLRTFSTATSATSQSLFLPIMCTPMTRLLRNLIETGHQWKRFCLDMSTLAAYLQAVADTG